MSQLPCPTSLVYKLQTKLSLVQLRACRERKKMMKQNEYIKRSSYYQNSQEEKSNSYSLRKSLNSCQDDNSSYNQNDESFEKMKQLQDAETVCNSPQLDRLQNFCDQKQTPQMLPQSGPNMQELSTFNLTSQNSMNYLDSQNFTWTPEEEYEQEFIKADKKNIVKNVAKGFKGYLEKWGCDTEIMEVLGIQDFQELMIWKKAFQYYFKKKKFNNQFIIDLFKHPRYSEIFKYFLINKSEQWLNNSQVQDKSSHMTMLNWYIESVQNENLLDKLKVLKTGQKKRCIVPPIY